MNKKGIIFDFNGTLLWDTHLHNTAWDNFFKEHGFFMSDEEKHQKMHGRLNNKWFKKEHIIVNSNDGDYKVCEGRHPIIKHFNEVN